uniref:Uncharacterized protein n=1 Tax=Dulem virus 62 TaxID=3145773 RepID=A0AAU8B228_9VIRU
MAKSFRLTDDEEKALYSVNLSVNRELIKIGKAPMTDSKILHIILEQTLKNGEVEVTRNGEIRVLSQSEC